MAKQVCGACGGNNPECDVCGGSGYDRPEPEVLEISEMGSDAVEQQILDEVNELFDHAQRAFDARVAILLMGLRAGFYGVVLMGGVLTLTLTFLAFLVGFYEIFVVASMAGITFTVVALTLALAYRVQTYDVDEFVNLNHEALEEVARHVKGLKGLSRRRRR